MTILLTLFAAGVLTILLPCILPLVPIVLGVSLSGRSKWRPLVTSAGMVVSFVVFTFVLQILLRQLVHLADLIRIATYYSLFLFGICFLTTRLQLQIALVTLGAIPFFWDQGGLVLLTTLFARCRCGGAGRSSGRADSTSRCRCPERCRVRIGPRVVAFGLCDWAHPWSRLGTVRGAGTGLRADACPR